jgi:predicted RNA-binding protein with TRAM domain
MNRVGFAVIVVALVGCQSDRVLPAPSALIQDALNNGGNPFFFWTPPVVNQQPPATQRFSANLSPVLTITNLCPGGGVVRTFSGSQINVSNARYHVNWRTSEDDLDSACIYRMTVTVGSTELGFADVEVVDNGRDLKNVNTDDFIPLLDDRTLPITFFIGVGSQCDRVDSDCGEGTARGGQNTTIVTTSGRAGVFIPANALADGDEVTISVESVDERTASGECIPDLPLQFPGTPGVADNACYDYHAVPTSRGTEQASRFTFINPVTVGICPDIDALELDHADLELLRIFQFDDFGEGSTTVALDNVSAPFLRCDPHFSPSFGARRSIFEDLGKALVALVTPRPLYASTSAVFDLGAGGSTEEFSRFTWALPSVEVIDFETVRDGSPACANCALTNQLAGWGVVFSFQPLLRTGECATLTNAQWFLSSPVYDPVEGPDNHSVTSAGLAGGGFCSGTVTLNLASHPTSVTFQIRGNNSISEYPVNAFDASGSQIDGEAISRSNVTTYTAPVFTGRQETVTIRNEGGIARIELVMNGFIVLVDNLQIAR